jgi:putative hydrolases of HD superfamily
MKYLEFFEAITKFKQIPRTGWVRAGVHKPESVADHSFGITVLAMVLADKFEKTINREKLMKMASIHDIGELAFGDTVVDRGAVLAGEKEMAEKNERERKKIRDVFDSIDAGEEYEQLFAEMIERKTPEAQIVKELDKLEMVMQALTYEKEQGKDLEEWFINAELYIKEPLLREIFQELLNTRKQVNH